MTTAWTRERPTKPGWYWCRSPRYPRPDCVEIVRDGDRLALRTTHHLWPLSDTSDANEWAPAEPPP